MKYWMHKLFSFLVLGALFAVSAHSQVVPAAQQRKFDLRVGGGYSTFYSDWRGNLSGPAVWIQWFPKTGIQGLGIEAEGSYLVYGQAKGLPFPKEMSYNGGLVYSVQHFQKFQPYAKGGIGVGRIEFGRISKSFPNYTHDSRILYSMGGGAEFKFLERVWIRGDFTYQGWMDFFRHHTLTPYGATVGLTYRLGNVQ